MVSQSKSHVKQRIDRAVEGHIVLINVILGLPDSATRAIKETVL